MFQCWLSLLLTLSSSYYSWDWMKMMIVVGLCFDTRQKQLAAWCSLALSYCRHRKLYTLDVLEAQESPLFNNKKISSILFMGHHLKSVVSFSRVTIYWFSQLRMTATTQQPQLSYTNRLRRN